MVRLHLFFFFNFGLTRLFRPIQADTADTDRVGPILASSAPISAESAPTSAVSARFGPCHMARRGPTWQGRAVCRVPVASPRPVALDAGAPALGPSPCIPGDKLHVHTLLELRLEVIRVSHDT